jgi:hypothetical protein
LELPRAFKNLNLLIIFNFENIHCLVNWANQIASNNDIQHGIAMHVNPLDKNKEGEAAADMILRS